MSRAKEVEFRPRGKERPNSFTATGERSDSLHYVDAAETAREPALHAQLQRVARAVWQLMIGGFETSRSERRRQGRSRTASGVVVAIRFCKQILGRRSKKYRNARQNFCGCCLIEEASLELGLIIVVGEAHGKPRGEVGRNAFLPQSVRTKCQVCSLTLYLHVALQLRKQKTRAQSLDAPPNSLRFPKRHTRDTLAGTPVVEVHVSVHSLGAALPTHRLRSSAVAHA
mmetsp:Transcript_57490/g.84331  ORF Transcript_57490/g.84331 Transcript_57490/m.84331 type:complete len:227 (+) Transcript_57490:97-777(+)